MAFDFSKVRAEKLSNLHDLSSFNCGDQDINEFLKKDAQTYQEQKIATTTLFIYHNEITGNDDLVGFFSAAADSIKLKLEEKESHGIGGKPIKDFPAVKIARLGRDARYKDQSIGLDILKWAIGHVLECSEMVAVRFVTVDAYPSKANWYGKVGFLKNSDKHYDKDDHVSMRYDLFNFSKL